MSHGDRIEKMPDGFHSIAQTDNSPVAAMADLDRNFYGLQFHPEVNDSEYGAKIFENFVDICRRAL